MMLANPEFIQAFGYMENTLDSTAAFLSSVQGDWCTQPRTPHQVFGVHYCFYSPSAPLQVTLEDHSERIPPNTLCWFPPGVFYELKMLSAREQEPFYRCRFRLRNGNTHLTPFHKFTTIPRASFSRQDIARCAGAFEDAGIYGDLRRRNEVCLFLMNVCEALPQTSENSPLGQALMMRLERFVAERMATWPSTKELAEVAGYHPAYFARLFRKQTGLTPRKWLVDRRVRFAARRLLESSLDVQTIAYECGYENPFFFSRQFKEIMGLSPRHWRAQNMDSSRE